MIFLSIYPSGKSDGMFERVKYIDKLFEGHDRIYLSMSLKSIHWSDHIAGNIRIISCNPILHNLKIRAILAKSNVIYAHSLVNAYKMIFFDLSNKFFIFDVHGSVPEEAEYLGGSKGLRIIYNFFEKWVLNRASLVISVSRNMLDYLRVKNSKLYSKKCLLLPIVGNVTNECFSIKKHQQVIYAGGVQKWQNVQLMLDFIHARPDLIYQILTPFPEYFFDVKHMQNVKISYADPESLQKYYQSAAFGFILRDKSILNHVACPTKLIEYLSMGIIPIVLDPNIGDFNMLGYKYVRYNDIIDGATAFYDEKDVQKNFDVVDELRKQQELGARHLVDMVDSILSR